MNPADDLPSPAACRQIPLGSIPTDETSQARVKIRPAVVRAYAQAMKQQLAEGSLRFPPVVLFSDGQRYWLADGFHRVLAAREAGLTEFPADVRPGSQRDALLYSISSNTGHGLPRNNADKRKAVSLLLADPEWSRWSDHEIARHCQVSQSMVSRLRKGASELGVQIEPRKVKRGHTVYEMQPKMRSAKEPAPDEGATAPATAAPACDRVGLPLPPDAAPAFAVAGDFATAEALLAQLAAVVDRLAQGAGGAAYRQHLVCRAGDGRASFSSPELKIFGQKLGSAAPHCGRCPRCQPRHAGRTQPACKLCGGRGWLSKAEFATCTHQERQELERWRTANGRG
jgi:hypothetical protein